MASFTSLGVGSNLPLDTLLNNLTIAEKKRLNPITQQQSDNTARLTAYGTLKSALEIFVIGGISTAIGIIAGKIFSV